MSRHTDGDSAQPSDVDETLSETPFEKALERLEEIVDQLEQGDLELEQALSAFEEGVRLSRHCAGQLDAAERRIEVLVQAGGEWVARELDSADRGGSDAAATGEEAGEGAGDWD